MAIPSAIIHNIMGKNMFPYTLWCIKIFRENIFFGLEEAHSSEQKLVSLQKSNILLLRDYFIQKYPWLDDSDETKYMSDKEILDKYINLDNSCLTKWERKEVRRLIFEYKDVFSLRDEIGTCPSIKVEIDVTDKSPFFIRPFHAREEDKAVLFRRRKRLCYLGILKEGFSAYSSPVLLISRKMTQDKGVVTDFRHLNVRIAKNNLAYPLLKDIFALLGSSKCEVMSVLDLKDAFHSPRLT